MVLRSTSSDNVSFNLEGLKADIDKLRSDLSSLAGYMKDIGGSAVADAQQIGAVSVDELRHGLTRTAQQLQRHGEVSIAEVEKTVRQRPLMSLIAALGVGMLITSLLDRR